MQSSYVRRLLQVLFLKKEREKGDSNPPWKYFLKEASLTSSFVQRKRGLENVFN